MSPLVRVLAPHATSTQAAQPRAVAMASKHLVLAACLLLLPTASVATDVDYCSEHRRLHAAGSVIEGGGAADFVDL